MQVVQRGDGGSRDQNGSIPVCLHEHVADACEAGRVHAGMHLFFCWLSLFIRINKQ